MTKVRIKKDNGDVISIEIDDHAGFSNHGNDIVCSAISAIVFGTLNALVSYDLSESKISIDDAFIKIDLTSDATIQVVASVMLIQLKTIQESYPEYISIETV